MDVAALIISLIAVITAIASAVYTRRAVEVAEKSRVIEQDPFLRVKKGAMIGVSSDEWILENTGNGRALNISITFDMDPYGRQYGYPSIDVLEPHSEVMISTTNPLPVFTGLYDRKTAKSERMTVEWRTGDGRKFSRSIAFIGD